MYYHFITLFRDKVCELGVIMESIIVDGGKSVSRVIRLRIMVFYYFILFTRGNENWGLGYYICDTGSKDLFPLPLYP